MTKLIIQIPCYNEAATLGITLSQLPRDIEGIDKVEWLIVDDGSTDQTVEVARAFGVDHVVSLPCNQGLAAAFMTGLDAGLKAGADIIVNTDADNQYCAADIPRLIAPILSGSAEIVVGARPISEIKHFSNTKKFLQKLGSLAVRLASSTNVIDSTSGFRALSRNAAMKMQVFNQYTYTLETIIQAGQQRMRIASVPIRTNAQLRPSRLVRSIPSYVRKSLFTILRISMLYNPLKFFLVLGSVPFVIGFLLGVRWLLLFLAGTERTHVPSLILAAVLLLIGFQLFIFGLVADLISVNRRLLEDVKLRNRQAELDYSGEASPSVTSASNAKVKADAENFSPPAQEHACSIQPAESRTINAP